MLLEHHKCCLELFSIPSAFPRAWNGLHQDFSAEASSSYAAETNPALSALAGRGDSFVSPQSPSQLCSSQDPEILTGTRHSDCHGEELGRWQMQWDVPDFFRKAQ